MTGPMLCYKSHTPLIKIQNTWVGLFQLQSHFLPHPLGLHLNMFLSSLLVQTPEKFKPYRLKIWSYTIIYVQKQAITVMERQFTPWKEEEDGTLKAVCLQSVSELF